MRISPLVPALVAAAMLTVPAAASAQQYPGGCQNPNNNCTWQQRHDNDDHRDRRDSDDHRDRDDHGYNRNGNGNGNYGNNGYGRNGNYGNNGYGRNGGYGSGNGQISGVVSSFSSFNMQLSNGPHVVLHQGTVINPTGTTLQPGMRVQVYGYQNSDGSYAANQINVIGNGYGNNGNYGNYGNGNVINPSSIGNILGRFGF